MRTKVTRDSLNHPSLLETWRNDLAAFGSVESALVAQDFYCVKSQLLPVAITMLRRFY
jgi:hypothetical protein